jgi:beta-lactamase regulating signal transducer with metallopeptidase domain
VTLLILCLAAVAMVSYAFSALTGVALLALNKPLSRLAAVAQARIYLFAALLPLVAALAVLTATLAPSFGWISDHHGLLGEVHSHPQLCFDHQVAGWPAVSLSVLALLLTLRFLFVLLRRVYALVLTQQTRRNLNQASHASSEAGIRILPTGEAQAFVLGLFRPTLYITEGLIKGSESHHLPAVIAHERAHLRRFDPLRRFVAGIGLSFHLPGVARWLNRSHARSQEMAADDAAAQDIGSRESVASALVALAKARFRIPAMAVAISDSDVEERVILLMDDGHRRDWPTAKILFSLALTALLVVAVGAQSVHHKVESLLGILGS